MADDANFWTWLREHKQGALHGELSEQLSELVSAVLEHNKAGTLTIKISVAPTKDGSTVFVSDDVKASVPTADRGGSIMFADDEGNLSRNNPRQMELPMRVIETVDEQPVEVDTTTGEVKELNA